ncbi:Uncharacterised protein [Plesiomonas shigelloides]|uniref:hypothetical protein n=1 Tax=Plesiomonas shigelloides TaxID=703 RepID=UPI0007F1486F|nr:hypothetical protein [Plesiomonas shigelloides]KAB7700412.1 hypothetical protein GBN33_05540 [Plesiomonas shigelloides]SBT61316.1 Uncharacterised protein [Plesiomonas shigelloides]
MNARQRYNFRRMAEFNARKAKEAAFNRKLEEAIGGCSIRVLNAVSVPKRHHSHSELGSTCLPKTAMYQAGYRRKQANVTARV